MILDLHVNEGEAVSKAHCVGRGSGKTREKINRVATLSQRLNIDNPDCKLGKLWQSHITDHHVHHGSEDFRNPKSRDA